MASSLASTSAAVVVTLAAASFPATAVSQEPLGTLSSPAATSRAPFAASFGLEWTGSTLGAAAASGAFLLTVEAGACGDDFECVMDKVAGLALISTTGSLIGLWTAKEIGKTDGSFWGGLAGALVGSAAGLVAADQLGGDSDIGIAVTLGLTQGLFTAIGSRIGAARR